MTLYEHPADPTVGELWRSSHGSTRRVREILIPEQTGTVFIRYRAPDGEPKWCSLDAWRTWASRATRIDAKSDGSQPVEP